MKLSTAMYRFAFLFFFLCSANSLQAQVTSDKDIHRFLKKNATAVKKESMLEQYKFFLDSRTRKKEMFWHMGSFTTTEGVKHEQVQLKFNIINNSLHLKLDGQYYQISTYSIREFSLVDQDRERHFSRGFNQGQIHTLSASYSNTALEVIQMLSAYENIEDFEIVDLKTHKRTLKKGMLSLQLRSPTGKAVYDLKNYLTANLNLSGADIHSTSVGKFDESIFFEIKIKGKDFQLLKHFSQKNTQSNAVAMVKDTELIPFSENTYYLASPQGEIQQILLTKRSLKKALEFASIDCPSKLPALRNEKQLLRFFDELAD